MFDIDNFPTSEMAKDMLSMVSPIYNEAYVGKWIYQIMGLAMQMASDTIKGTLEEGFPQTATYTLPWWEDMYGLPVNPDLPVEERRNKIVIRRTTKRPMNPAAIERIVTQVSGRSCHLEENTDVYTYEIRIYNGESAVVYDTVREEVDKIRQAKNVIIVFETRVGIKIRAEPKKARYPYEMTSTLLKAGTHPEPNVIGKVTEIPVEIDPDETRKPFPYVMAGTRPEPNVIGKITETPVEIDPDETRKSFPYVMTGTAPEPANVGVAEYPGVFASATMEHYGTVYKMCGLRKM